MNDEQKQELMKRTGDAMIKAGCGAVEEWFGSKKTPDDFDIGAFMLSASINVFTATLEAEAECYCDDHKADFGLTVMKALMKIIAEHTGGEVVGFEEGSIH